ncbi:MAG: ATP-dependent Clp protease ATP-binding subunit [Anaerolineales bacterium]|nr:ATP-dependent Clp protease ATP-binding subunit [Anaerolineales bacterium]
MASNRGTLSTKIPSPELAQILNQAAALMRVYHIPVMTPEILLLAMLKTPDSAAQQLLRNFSQERGFDWSDFERDVERAVSDQRWLRGANADLKDARFDFVTSANERVPLSEKLLVVLDEGLTLANQQGLAQCSSTQALAVIAGLGTRSDLALRKRGITAKAVQDVLNLSALPLDATGPAKNRPAATIYMRQDLLLKLVSRLTMAGKRHVILVGPTGVGKRSLVLALRQLIAEGKGPAGLRGVVPISEQALLTSPVEAVQQAVRQAQGGVLFVPDIARFFGGLRADFREDVCNELQKAFFSDNVTVIGTATPERYNERLSKATVVVEQSQVLHVPPATIDETIEILKVQRPALEADYNLTIAEASLVEAARLGGRYYTVRPLPSAAVHLLHQACAMLRMNPRMSAEAPVKSDNQLDPDDVMIATSMLTGIPVTNLGADERDRYVNMFDHLRKRIIGQSEAILALSRAVKMARVGLKDPKRPIGSFLFLGPTGVGKTELAKALAEFLFGTEDALLTFDMSEFMDESSVNRLIGSPPGYVDSQAGGQLTEAVKKRPYSVILFDEVEKASLKVFDVFLQVMDEGRLTSGQGETVSFSECVIIMTSNAGGRFLADPQLSEAAAREMAEQAVKEHFRPEFLNRLDEIIYFHSLSQEDMRQILDLLLRKEEKLMAGRNLHLEMTEGAKNWLLKQNDHPEWGARPLRRLIQKHIREPMADFLLKEDPPAGTIIKMQVKGKNLEFKTTHPS